MGEEPKKIMTKSISAQDTDAVDVDVCVHMGVR